MKLLRVHIIKAKTCGGLLDGFDCHLRSPFEKSASFDPLCLIGPNGTGKSQFLQIVAEIFQTIYNIVVPDEEGEESNRSLRFVVEYLIAAKPNAPLIHVRVSRLDAARQRSVFQIERKMAGKWISCDPQDKSTRLLLPSKVVGYTSGGNETLSLPFLISRACYAEKVRESAFRPAVTSNKIPDTRLMLIDYSTHLEVLVSNLLLGNDAQRTALLNDAHLDHLHSFRCVIQLAHPAVRNKLNDNSRYKGIRLTNELSRYIEQLKKCSTSYDYSAEDERYIFDFLITKETLRAFQHFWINSLDLYVSFHKLSMLNDLAIKRTIRDRFKKETLDRRFALKLPEPQDEDKVFKFERVCFAPDTKATVVNYVSLSDGEHQQAQLLGMFGMLSSPNVLFLLDEPESHFNPQWRVKFVSRLLELPTIKGTRKGTGAIASQECVLTTHAPFVPSDMHRENVFLFGKESGFITVKRPDIETYGANFDTILEQCFGVRPPISDLSNTELEKLMKSKSARKIRAGIVKFGSSDEKMFLADRLRELQNRK